ncbi:MAG: PucR family transcriptional regulator ligand-binding domain-containing protein [Anaerovorax sp.]|nr:PucR family transcriptional regulator ligand-binding domain-containing protein [Anaerovorax sp.]
MNYTVSDFYGTFAGGVKIIAGRRGLSRVIKDAGILDYELEPTLKNKYFHINFHEGQFALTTFLYAKENHYLVSDAVKHLVAKGASGLAIKNVFKLPISDSIIRYADSMNFPIFLIESNKIYFEKIIYEIDSHSNLMASTDFIQKEIDILLNHPLTEAERITHAKMINPSSENQFFTIHFRGNDFFTEVQFKKYYNLFQKNSLNSLGTSLCYYKHGMLLTYSCDNISEFYKENFIEKMINTVLSDSEEFITGISACHYKLDEYSDSITESIYASLNISKEKEKIHYFNHLGIFKLLLPHCTSPSMQNFCKSILEKVLEYDMENGTKLLPTLETFVDYGQNISEAAEILKQHENTVRYRLDKITAITDLSWKKPSHAEQLSIAIKIHQCNQCFQV